MLKVFESDTDMRRHPQLTIGVTTDATMLTTPALNLVRALRKRGGSFMKRLFAVGVLATMVAGVALAVDTITVADAAFQEGSTSNTVSITYSGTTSATAFDLILTYPTGSATFVSAAAGTATSGWTIDSNVAVAGTLDIGIAVASGGTPITTGEIAVITFSGASVTGWADVSYDTSTAGALALTEANVNDTAGTAVDGALTIQPIVHGDVTGNDAITAYDASFGLQSVVDETTTGWPLDIPATLPAYNTTPTWTVLGAGFTYTVGQALNDYSAFALLDVDENDLVQAADVAEILQYAVGSITSFSGTSATPTVPPAPSGATTYMSERIHTSSPSTRPGSSITVSLDLRELGDLYAGEFMLAYDPALLRPISATMDTVDGVEDGSAPMVAFRDHGGMVKAAFASSNQIQGRTLNVVFETTQYVSERRISAIRDAGLVLNRTQVDTGFEFNYELTPYNNRLMANFPNPFNPETWIPFELENASDVSIRIYGMDGAPVRTLELGQKAVGVYADTTSAAYWDGRNENGETVASGAYIYEITAGDYHAMRRMVVLK
jgi:hypothetical protein